MAAMYQRVVLFYNSYIKHYLFPQAEESNEGYQNHHKKKIQIAGQAIQNPTLPLDIRLQAVQDIGLLAYTGRLLYCAVYISTYNIKHLLYILYNKPILVYHFLTLTQAN